ncbi:MAG: signal peptidase I [Clostridia bacterium]|nr:signal peptidase I [Clostridia bacterium]
MDNDLNVTPAADAAEQSKQDRSKKEKEKKGFIANLLEWVELFAVSVAIVMTVLVCIGRHSPVIGSSMNETLQQDDLLIISDLFYTPKQGDIIVFESQKTTYEKPYVKRIIATSGQTVDYDRSTGEVTVDGKLLYEDYAVYKGIERTYYNAGIEYPYTVPEGHVFVMGDNRWNSTDSRDIGPVDQRCIIGHVIFRLFPFKNFRTF